MANTPTSDSAPVPFHAFFAESARTATAEAGLEFCPSEFVRPGPVYLTSAVCLLLGLCVGYVWHGFQSRPPAAAASATVSRSPHAANRHVPTLDEMKKMADQQAAPVLDKLKTEPHNAALLMQAGAIYHASHQFKEAADYYEKAVQADPKNVEARSRLASSLYRSGDADGAIAELNRGLTYDPRDANSLFNLGMIRLQGKGDGKGALAAWQQLLKSNPQLSPERKAEVQKLMADVLTTMAGSQQSRKKGGAGQ